MLRNCIIAIFLSVFLIHCLFAQDKSAFKKAFLEAEYFFMIEEYEEALFHYTELEKTDPTNSNLKFLIGACYLSIYGQKGNSIPYLEYAVDHIVAGYREGSYKERNAPREALFALARAYHINYQFDMAINHYERYRNAMIKQHFADIEYVNHQIKSCELGKSMITRPVEVRFLNMGESVNRYNANYNPVISLNDSILIFMTDKPMYHAILMSVRSKNGWSIPREINDEIGSDGNCTATALSANGRELYVVKSDPFESDIYVSEFDGSKWSPIQRLNKNVNSDYYETHASISFDGSKLYFTSDRPGGQGALDIYVSKRSRGGDWGPAINLGPKVNSFYNENTPAVTENGRSLYFSSQGHATMGGYDIFFSTFLPDGTWSYPQNIGYPVSSADDDLFYVPRRNGNWGYYSTINDSINENRNIYALRFGPEQELEIGIRRQDEVIEDSIEIERIEVTIPVVTQPEIHEATPDEYHVLNSIMFDFDDYSLNNEALKEADRLLEVMLKYPVLEVELTGHTDAVGADEYNLRLAQRRAESVKQYLVENGIDQERIGVISAGEAAPIAINEYEDGTDSQEGRRLNRHVSIKFTNLQDENVKVADIFVPEEFRPKKDLSFSIFLLNSDTYIDTMPDEIAGEGIALIITDKAFLYTSGNFDRKVDAMKHLNEVIDLGFPDAMMLEKIELEDLIREMSDTDLPIIITYTIQIMALENPVEVSYFKDLDDVRKYLGRDGLYRYVYGEFSSIDEALEKLPAIQSMGYHDAFIMYLARYREIE